MRTSSGILSPEQAQPRENQKFLNRQVQGKAHLVKSSGETEAQRSRYKNEGSKATDLNLVSGVSTVSPLHVNLQVANFQRFEHAVHVSNPLSSHVWRTLSRACTLCRWLCFCVLYCTVPYGMEKAMAPHSSTLAWKIPWMEEPGRLQSIGSLRVGHD